MKRTKLNDRVLPAYTKAEERINMISHIVGGALGVVVLLACLLISISKKNVWGIVAGSIYGASFIQLYVMSSVYHGLKPGKGKKVLQILDHCIIYVFIAGSYTPITLCALRPLHPGWAWSLFGVVWGLAALAIVFNAIDLKKYAVFSMICYIAMGWCVVVGMKPTIEALSSRGMALLVLGGVAYTLGAVLYGIGSKRRYFHSAFHVLVLIGSILHALCMLFYVL